MKGETWGMILFFGWVGIIVTVWVTRAWVRRSTFGKNASYIFESLQALEFAKGNLKLAGLQVPGLDEAIGSVRNILAERAVSNVGQ